MTILVVEDESSIREILTHVVESTFPGALVLSAACGSDALAAVQTHGMPDLIFLDLGLPDMSGFDVYAALQKQGCNAKVVVITAEDEPTQRNRAARMGADVFMPKPFDSRELKTILKILYDPDDALLPVPA